MEKSTAIFALKSRLEMERTVLRLCRYLILFSAGVLLYYHHFATSHRPMVYLVISLILAFATLLAFYKMSVSKKLLKQLKEVDS